MAFNSFGTYVDASRFDGVIVLVTFLPSVIVASSICSLDSSIVSFYVNSENDQQKPAPEYEISVEDRFEALLEITVNQLYVV